MLPTVGTRTTFTGHDGAASPARDDRARWEVWRAVLELPRAFLRPWETILEVLKAVWETLTAILGLRRQPRAKISFLRWFLVGFWSELGDYWLGLGAIWRSERTVAAVAAVGWLFCCCFVIRFRVVFVVCCFCCFSCLRYTFFGCLRLLLARTRHSCSNRIDLNRMRYGCSRRGCGTAAPIASKQKFAPYFFDF